VQLNAMNETKKQSEVGMCWPNTEENRDRTSSWLPEKGLPQLRIIIIERQDDKRR